jgi:hypothetical protein
LIERPDLAGGKCRSVMILALCEIQWVIKF